jgi:hypothetical protein
VEDSTNHNESVPSFPYATPVFGLADIDGSLFVDDAGAGIVELRNGKGLGAFEASVNPDGGAIDSNPFDVAVTPRGTRRRGRGRPCAAPRRLAGRLTMPIAVTEGKRRSSRSAALIKKA